MNQISSESNIESRVGRKVMTFLVAPIGLYLLIGAIDRTNVGFAALQMNADLRLTGAEYGAGAGILFIGYLLAKYPSVLLYEQLGLRRWLCLLCLVWGVCATGMAFVQGRNSFYLLRFLIGVSEAGLAAGLFLYLSNWASAKFSASILSIPIAAIPLAQVVGAPLSGWLMEMENPFNMPGWRWMFLIEGLPAIGLAVLAMTYFPNRPKQASWLSSEEADWIEANADGAQSEAAKTGDKHAALKNPITYICAIIWFCLLAGNYGVIFWLPQILKSFADLSATQIGWIVAMPWLGSAIGLVINAIHSDKTQERYLHIGIPCLIAAIGFVTAFHIGQGPLALLCLIVGGAFLGSTVAPFWAIPKKLLKPAELQIGVVAIHMAGGMAGLSISSAIGWLHDMTGSFGPPIYLIGATQVLSLSMCLIARKLDKSHRGSAIELDAPDVAVKSGA